MNAKYTPGPWLVNGVSVHTEDNQRIVGPGIGVPNEEAKANACLIATAPDLLEALKALLEVSIEPGMQDIDAWKRDKRHAEALARVAIAKVEGTP